MWALEHVGFSSCSTQASVVVACRPSSCGSRALERRLISCGAQAYLLHSMWDLPGLGIEPVVPCIGRLILNHCTTKEVPTCFILEEDI